MSHWDEIRRRAGDKHNALAAEMSQFPAAEALLFAAEAESGISRIPLESGDPLLYGAQAALYEDMIFYNADAPEWQAVFSQAHEYAHHWLGHGTREPCSAADVDPEAEVEGGSSASGKIQGYGPRERREREANAFALEFLLPREALRRWYLADGMGADTIADATGAPSHVVLNQLGAALFAVPAAHESEALEASPIRLDPSQEAAAYAERGPLLLEAGPGTGKTRTLVARVLHLIRRGTPPTQILALTFSNKAAEEMRGRVAAYVPAEAPLLWMGTFHAFGLELLSKYGTRIGLPPSVGLLEPVDALLMLERSLPQLGLSHYENLYEPTIYLRDIMSAISRAKDELVTPERYRELAQAMVDGAESDTEREAGERALEVAGVYEFYNRYLEQEGLLDFGDLIGRAVELLREHHDIRVAVRGSYSEILVDEYQDVNRASGVFLRELAGAGQGLWVVGDARQAIYRFRGAAPDNMLLFSTHDFPGATVQRLAVNYRSLPAIVGTFATFAPRMSATSQEEFKPWEVARPDGPGVVELAIAEDEVAEGEGIAREILARHAAGVAFGDQVVLMRSHGGLARIGAALERAGVPLLYLGNLFERPEVRDLLTLLALASGDGSALVRVATMPDYAIPPDDVRRVLPLLRGREGEIAELLRDVAEVSELSAAGCAGLLRLAGHLDALAGEISVWRYLSLYLFGLSDYARLLLADDTPPGQSRRIAVYLLIRFAREQERRLMRSGDPIRAFLRYIRRLELFGEDRSLRQVPDWAEGIDAVRLLTVHASKGLEFRVVYLPGLGKGYFPARGVSSACPPPYGMLPGSAISDRDEEEECLFFVALSRARDRLVLSRAVKYGATRSNPSPLLDQIAESLPVKSDAAPTWSRMSPPVPEREHADPPELTPQYSVQNVELYMECPRRFYYEVVAELAGESDDTVYYKFHLSVREVLNWLTERREVGQDVETAAALEQLQQVWENAGPVGHDHEAIYWRWAEAMVTRAALGKPQTGRSVIQGWEVPLPYGRVTFVPDHAEVVEEGGSTSVRLERRRTGRRSPTEHERNIYALYQTAATSAYPTATTDVQVHYLAVGERESVQMSDKKLQTRLDRYNKALRGIYEGDFTPAPSDRTCPRCPFYFICPTMLGGEGADA